MKRRIIIPAVVVLAIFLGLGGYFAGYYHETDTAQAALLSSESVGVSKTDYGWFFDGAGEDMLIFYPGAKVSEAAYAPLLHGLAQAGCDAALVKMPLHMAFFGMNKADAIIEECPGRCFVGGHSLGGAMAAVYAASHETDGVIAFAAYPTKALDEPVLLLAGTEDGVLNWEKYAHGKTLADCTEVLIAGGNHAGFGNYGEQKGDGAAGILSDDQQSIAVAAIMDWLNALKE